MKLAGGQVALVTGASRGLGAVIARSLAERGLRLVLAARSTDALRAVTEEARVAGAPDVVAIAADFGDPEGVAALARAVEEAGGVDVLVNNAGVDRTRRFEERTAGEIAEMIAINLTAPLLLTRALLPGMIARGQGHVVNVASIGGLIAGAFEEPYNATKFGLVGFTRALRLSARTYGWNVSASAICPGFMSGAGIFEDTKREFGVRAPGSMPEIDVAAIGPAVVRAIERDLPDVVLGSAKLRLGAALSVLLPRAFERTLLRSDVADVFRAVAEARGRER